MTLLPKLYNNSQTAKITAADSFAATSSYDYLLHYMYYP
jgi:hypothetical protein